MLCCYCSFCDIPSLYIEEFLQEAFFLLNFISNVRKKIWKNVNQITKSKLALSAIDSLPGMQKVLTLSILKTSIFLNFWKWWLFFLFSHSTHCFIFEWPQFCKKRAIFKLMITGLITYKSFFTFYPFLLVSSKSCGQEFSVPLSLVCPSSVTKLWTKLLQNMSGLIPFQTKLMKKPSILQSPKTIRYLIGHYQIDFTISTPSKKRGQYYLRRGSIIKK